MGGFGGLKGVGSGLSMAAIWASWSSLVWDSDNDIEQDEELKKGQLDLLDTRQV